VLSQDAAHGALPTLRAATSPEAGPGSYFGPACMLGLKGVPVEIGLPRPARDEATATRLWSVAEQLTGVAFTLPPRAGGDALGAARPTSSSSPAKER
jgi:hypothetical protein